MRFPRNTVAVLFATGLVAATTANVGCGSESESTNGTIVGGSGGTAAGACTALEACCNQMPASPKAACRQMRNQYQGQSDGEGKCSGALDTYRAGGQCGASDGGAGTGSDVGGAGGTGGSLPDASADMSIEASGGIGGAGDAGGQGGADAEADQQTEDGDAAGAGGRTAIEDWVTIRAGKFMMGSPSIEPCRYDPDMPKENWGLETQHEVTLTHDFLMHTTEVDKRQFLAKMGYDPSYPTSCEETCPVDTVTWDESAAYCNALSASEGLDPCYSCAGSKLDTECREASSYSSENIYLCPGYRLPTEAEWEYAYRAGTTTPLYSGDLTVCEDEFDPNADAIAWYAANSWTEGDGFSSKPVGQKMANGWGLYDMAGNVREWVHDKYEKDLLADPVTDPWGSKDSDQRVTRNGSNYWGARQLRAAYRYHFLPGGHQLDIGFRCARTLLQDK